MRTGKFLRTSPNISDNLWAVPNHHCSRIRGHVKVSTCSNQLAFECSTSFHIIDILRHREHWYGQTHCCRQTNQGNTWLDSNTKWSRWVRILPGPSKEQKYLIRLSARCSASCSSCLTTFRWCRNCRLVRSRCDYLHACTCSEQTYPAKWSNQNQPSTVSTSMKSFICLFQ